MKNVFAKLSILLALALTGCVKGNESSSYTPPKPGEKTWVDESDYTYTNRIVEPSSVVHNMYELSLITDYHAFYKDTDKFSITIADDYVYSSPQRTIDSEINYLYWYGELVNGVMGIHGDKISSNRWDISYYYYNNASVDGRKNSEVLTDLGYKKHTQTRSTTYNEFATEDINKPVADVATTQQLWYAAEWGYRINPIANSPAEKYYNKAKQVLRKIIDDEMDEYTKTSAIYDYIEHNSTYCFDALNTPTAQDPINFPDEYCATYKAFFIEGFFDNQTVVCDGYSKIYTLLARMEGLNTYRGSGTSDTMWVSKEVAGHAYCFTEINGKYYLSCPTWGQDISYDYSYTTLNKRYFLAPRSYMDDYYCYSWENLDYATNSNNERYFHDHGFILDNHEYSLYVEDGDSLNPYISMLNANTDSFLDLYFESVEARDNAYQVLYPYFEVSGMYNENELIVINV